MRSFKTRSIWLFIITFLIFPNLSKASHVLGGQVSWKCLPSGEFQFYATVYRDCTGIDLPFINEFLSIVGNPLPRNSQHSTISSVLLRPDSNRWITSNFGDVSPECLSSGQQLSCDDGDPGSIQQFFYRSDPIRLIGVPPDSAWTFWFSSLPCCRPNITNLATSGTQMLRAVMYPNASRDSVSQCFDSSPSFAAEPQFAFCRQMLIKRQSSAFDLDGDSLAFQFDRTFNDPPTAPQPVPFANGFSLNSPLPDTSFDPNNIPAQLDPLTGLLTFYNEDRSSRTYNFLVVFEVSSYQDGKKVSSVFHETPILMFDCGVLSNSQVNNPPSLQIAGRENNYRLEVMAGEPINLPIKIKESDVDSTGRQAFQMIAEGEQFSVDFNDTTACLNPPCAIFTGVSPTLDPLAQEFKFNGQDSLLTTFSWQTTCAHLAPNGGSRSYRFFFDVQDDYCPIPGRTGGSILITVRDYEGNPPSWNCGSLSGSDLLLDWDTESLDSSRFVQWKLRKRSNGGPWRFIDSASQFSNSSYLDETYDSSFQEYQLILTNNALCGLGNAKVESEIYSYDPIVSATVFSTNMSLQTTFDSSATYQWFDCVRQTNVIGEESNVFSPQDSGSYAVIIQKKFCVDTSACFDLRAIGIRELQWQQTLNLYPNPTNGLVFIDGVDQAFDYQIFNIQGKLMKRGRLAADQNQMELPEAEGLYFVSLRDEAGNVKTYKLIRQ